MKYSLRSSTIRDTWDSPSIGSDTVHRHTVRSSRYLGPSEENAATASSESPTTLDYGVKSPLTPEIFKAAKEVVRQICPNVRFRYKGETYYGAIMVNLTNLPHSDRTKCGMLAPMETLEAILRWCGDTEWTTVLSVFSDEYRKSITRKFFAGTRSFNCHARRVMYRLIVCFQGYYDHLQYARAILDQPSVSTKGKCRSNDFWIAELYTKWPKGWSALRYLKKQLFKLPLLLQKLLRRLAESVPSQFQRLTAKSAGFTEGSSVPSHLTRSLDLKSTRSQSIEPVGSSDVKSSAPSSSPMSFSGSTEPSTLSLDVIHKARETIQMACPDVSFPHGGEMYYGIEHWEMMNLRSHDPKPLRVKAVLGLLEFVAGEWLQEDLVRTLTIFKSATKGAQARAVQRACRPFLCHGRRLLSRIVVCLQGYYHFNPGEKGELDVYTPDRNSQHDPSRDATIRQIYKKRPRNWSAFRYLKWQLLKVSELLTITKGSGPTSFAVADPGADPVDEQDSEELDSHLNLTGSARSTIWGGSVSETPEPAPEPQTEASVSGSTTTPGLIADWDVSDVAVLESLATQYLRDDMPAEEVDAQLKNLLRERQLLQLHESSRVYLTTKLLPGLEDGNQSQHDELAILLGYFDWRRGRASDAEAELPSLDDSYGELYDDFYNRGIALIRPTLLERV